MQNAHPGYHTFVEKFRFGEIEIMRLFEIEKFSTSRTYADFQI